MSLTITTETALRVSEVFRIQSIVIIVETVAFGFYMGVFGLSIWFTLRKGLQRKGNIFMLSLTAVMFSISACHWGLSVAFTIIAAQCQTQLILSPGAHYPSVMLRIVAVQAHLSIINYMLNDVVVIWRAWILCGPKARRWIWLVSVLTLVAESVLAVYKPAVDPHYWTQFFDGITIEGATQADSFTDGSYLQPLYAAYCLTLVTNVWPTVIIGYKAWTHQKLIAGTSVEHGSRALRILVLLVESGAIYCVIWAIHLCFFFLNAFGSSVVHHPTSWIPVAYSAIYVSANDLAGIYPTIIIVLVCLQKTFHESRALSPSKILTPLPLHTQAFDVATHTIPRSVSLRLPQELALPSSSDMRADDRFEVVIVSERKSDLEDVGYGIRASAQIQSAAAERVSHVLGGPTEENGACGVSLVP